MCQSHWQFDDGYEFSRAIQVDQFTNIETNRHNKKKKKNAPLLLQIDYDTVTGNFETLDKVKIVCETKNNEFMA